MSDLVSMSFVKGLGVLAHGPCVLSSGPGIGIGLRCVFAYPDGLLLSVQVKAIGQAATDAHDSSSHPRSGRGGRAGRRHPSAPRLPLSQVKLRVPVEPGVNDHLRLSHHHSSTAHTARGYSADTPGTRVHVHDLDVWWPAVPLDARLPVEAGWPEVGAPMTTTVLNLGDLDGLADRVVRLR